MAGENGTNGKVETAWEKVERDPLAPPVEPGPIVPVLQEWVMRLGLRLQGVLVSAIRGCDTVQRHDHSKVLARVYRAEILNAYGLDPKKSKSFILWADIPATVEMMKKFLNDCDHLPNHYVMHFIHAAEILGYCHPDAERRDMWASFYRVACKKFHLRPETAAELLDRLNKDEDNFHKAQDVDVVAKLYNDNEPKRAAAREEERLKSLRFGQYGGS
jgi:hypothetical protein